MSAIINISLTINKRNYCINKRESVKTQYKKIQKNSIFSNNKYKSKNKPYQYNYNKSELQNEATNEPMSSNDETNKDDKEEIKALQLNRDNINDKRNDILYFISKIPIQKIGIWILFGIIVHKLKDFFGIIMGTLVLSVIGTSFADSKKLKSSIAFIPKIEHRKILVILYYSLIIFLLGLFGSITIPDIVKEGIDIVERLKNNNIWLVIIEKMRSGLSDDIMEQMEKFIFLLSSDNMTQSSNVLLSSVWTSERINNLAFALQKISKSYIDTAILFTTNFISFTIKFVLQIIISLILSFIFVWDAPQISNGISKLKHSRFSAIYNEVAPNLQAFGHLFGKALQAQANISIVNTMFTAIGLYYLQIPNIIFLSMLTFICGFIPIAGVFISTVPMGFLALTEYGFIKLIALIFMVIGIHFIEAYGLNPLIYSSHLKLHPLLVLSVLIIAEHALGVWGLMLAVPLTVFILDYFIKYPVSDVQKIISIE